MPPPPPHRPKVVLPPSDRVLLTVTLPDGSKPCDRERRKSDEIHRHGEYFIMEVVALNGVKLEIRFHQDTIKEHQTRIASLLLGGV